MTSFASKLKAHSKRQKWLSEEIHVGYYLVVKHTGKRHWFSENVNEYALEKACKALLDDNNYDYWIDYCSGLLVDGTPGWSNLDFVDHFI